MGLVGGFDIGAKGLFALLGGFEGFAGSGLPVLGGGEALRHLEAFSRWQGGEAVFDLGGGGGQSDLRVGKRIGEIAGPEILEARLGGGDFLFEGLAVRHDFCSLLGICDGQLIEQCGDFLFEVVNLAAGFGERGATTRLDAQAGAIGQGNFGGLSDDLQRGDLKRLIVQKDGLGRRDQLDACGDGLESASSLGMLGFKGAEGLELLRRDGRKARKGFAVGGEGFFDDGDVFRLRNECLMERAFFKLVDACVREVVMLAGETEVISHGIGRNSGFIGIGGGRGALFGEDGELLLRRNKGFAGSGGFGVEAADLLVGLRFMEQGGGDLGVQERLLFNLGTEFARLGRRGLGDCELLAQVG